MRLWDRQHRDHLLWWHHRGRSGMTSGPIAALEVKEVDGSPDVNNVTIIRVSNGTLTDNGGGQVTINTTGGGGTALTVKEVDGSPSVANVNTIRVSNGTLIDDGGGQVTITTGGGGGGGGANSSSFQAFDIQVPPTSPSALDDEFNGSSLDAKWTQVNWAGLTSYDVNSTKPGALWTNNASGGLLLRTILQAIPAGDFTIITRLWPAAQDETNFSQLGLLLTDGTTAGAGNQYFFGLAQIHDVQRLTYTNFDTFNSFLQADRIADASPTIFQISRSGTTYTLTFSYDGRTFLPYFSGTLPFTPTNFGLVVGNQGTGRQVQTSFDFFRYDASPTAMFGGLVTYGGGLVVAPKTAAYTVLTGDVNTFFTNEGATAREDFSLPAAAANLTYSFYVQDADGVRVIAASGDTIRLAGSVSAAAGRIDSTTIGSCVTLVAINATEWVAQSITGTWVVT
jgi:hypothetical protein